MKTLSSLLLLVTLSTVVSGVSVTFSGNQLLCNNELCQKHPLSQITCNEDEQCTAADLPNHFHLITGTIRCARPLDLIANKCTLEYILLKQRSHSNSLHSPMMLLVMIVAFPFLIACLTPTQNFFQPPETEE
jgi:hypothetical protein